MNKSTLLTGIVIIGCIVTLLISYNIYQSRIESITDQSSSPVKLNPQDKKVTSKIKEPDKEDASTSSGSITPEQITTLTANMSEEVSSVITSRLQAGEKIQMLIIGSSSIEDGTPGYGELMKTNLSEAYGESIETTTLSFDGTTAALVEELENNLIDWSKDYDVILLEGMNLSNNGNVIVEDAVEHIETVNEKMKQSVKDAVLVVHPSQPLPNAIYYPTEVESFKSYLTSRGFSYIDHWSEWPVGNEEEMNTYLTEESVPNDKGAALWASALSTFFTGK
ncbi:MAG: SGNH/GDSL hydrolase family protein [Psychrobacillus psychrotolerans]